MSKWEMVRLRDVCLENILKLSQKDEFLIDYIDISSVDNEKNRIVSYQTLTPKNAPSRAKQILKKDDIIVSTVRPNLNGVAINNLNTKNIVVASTGFCVLRCKETADLRYVFNYCKSKAFINRLVKVAKGASYPAVSNFDVRNSFIPLPPLEVQNQIANTLDKAQEIIDGHKKQLEELNNLIKAIFYDMFGDPVTNERGWRVEKLSEKSILQSGGTPPREKIEYFNGTIPWITTVALNKLFIGHDDANEYISEEAVNNSATKIIPAYSILFGTRVGVGKVSINIVDMCTNQDVVAITNIDDKCLNKTFLIETLKKFSGYYNEQKRGATIKGITSSVLKETEIILPSLHLQNKFATIVTNIEEQKAIVKKSIEESKTLFYSLMNKYFE